MADTSPLEQTESLRVEFKRLTSAAAGFARNLTPAQWTLRPAENRWSIAECIDHLTLTTNELLPRLEAALRGAPPGPASLFKTRLLERILLWYLEPPYRRGNPTLPPFEPRIAGAPEQVLPLFTESQHRIEIYLQSAAGLALDRVRIQSPVNARLRYSAWGALLILAAHQRRHLWQAAQVQKELEALPRP